jgi:VWFA-related protein
MVAFVSLTLTCCFITNVAAQILSGSRVTIEPRANAAKIAGAGANIRVDSNLVLIPVTVTDRKSRFVTGLNRDYFKVFEDEREQTISHFAIEDAPISVTIVFDCSSSMKHKMRSAREAVGQFLRAAMPGDEFSLITFSSRPHMSLPFTDDTGQIKDWLSASEPSGNTALIDAIHLALTHLKRARNTRKSILIVSDGADNASRYSIGELKRDVRESDAQIFAIAILGTGVYMPSFLEESLRAELLREISDETGGQTFRAESLKEFAEIASRIGVALRTQYVLGYMPTDSLKDGKFHSVKVQLAESVPKSKLRLSWRRGYYAPLE